MSKNSIETDCTKQCRSRHHGQALTSAITKRSVTDESLASFIKSTCSNFTQAFDFEGRTALHMCASRGRTRLMDWLIRHSSEAFVNARDRESGYTPLHRSIFYGQIHATVALLKLGVNTDIVDKDDYKAIDHALLDRRYMHKFDGTEPCDVYVWGANCNYTLGTGTQQQRRVPELLSCFSRTNVCVKQVCIGKFHTVFVCEYAGSTTAYCCGQIGRAGGGGAGGTLVRPAELRLPERCLRVALMLHATVFLLQSGSVIQYSMNNEYGTNQTSAKSFDVIQLPSVKPLIKLSKPIDVCAGRSHAVVWNNRGIYTWGLNLGQLGHPQEYNTLTSPRKVPITMNSKEESAFQLVSASDAATLFTTSRGDVYLLHKYICKKIAVKQINLRQVCVEAKVSEQGVYSRVTALLLTNVGQLMIWQDNTNKLTRCVFGLGHETAITNVALTHDALYYTTTYGEAFIGTISRKSPPRLQTQPIKREKDNNKSSSVKFLEKDDCTPIRISRFPNIHRAVSVVVDNEGLNFACLQVKPSSGLRSLPQLSPSSLVKDMAYLLETATEDDMVHDVVFKVGSKSYPAHMFIIASSSEYLYKLYQEKQSEDRQKIPEVNLNTVHPEVFERILRFMYTGTCDVAELGPCGLKIKKEDLNRLKEKTCDDIDAELIENPSEISAAEVYQQHNFKNKKGNKARQSTDKQPQQHMYCDPVKLVQAAAKRLQVMALHKLLDKFYYTGGQVEMKANAVPGQDGGPEWRERRGAGDALADVHVRGTGGRALPAHRCVLAARLQYFRAMFAHCWTENKLMSEVTLPINHTLLSPIIDFLYTDRCPEIEDCDSIEFVCNMLIVADQLFITRLREMCEITLANLISLKNCAELCQFAHTYNAPQLKRCCMEFISLNISSVLDDRSLEPLENSLILDITDYYCKFNPIMASRVITPFCNAPSDKAVENSFTACRVVLDITDDSVLREDNVTKTNKKKNKTSKKIEYSESEKAKLKYESISPVISPDNTKASLKDEILSVGKTHKETEKGAFELQEKWTKIPSTQRTQQKITQARLKVIAGLKESLNENPAESFVKLTKGRSMSATAKNIDNSTITSRVSVSPIESPFDEMARSPQGNLIINHIGPKLSQKQKKKLAMQGVEQSTVQDLNEYFDTKVILGSPPIKNPWKVIDAPVTSSSCKINEFSQILADQKKQKDDSSRIMTKSLALTQLEDKAIEELGRFYNIHEIDDELITIRRIELQVSPPQWLHNTSK